MGNEAWFPYEFANVNHQPLVCCISDGNDTADRITICGSWDGYIRALDPDATDDDGTPIDSSVTIGPILTATTDDMDLKEIQAVLGEASGVVHYAVHVGRTAEAALASVPVQQGVWTSGRNPTNLVRRSGHAVYVKLSSSSQWAMETIRAVIDTRGATRQRRQY
jgi:hypothetical protein